MGLTSRLLGALALIGLYACTVSRSGLAPPDGGEDGGVRQGDGAIGPDGACTPQLCDDGIECTRNACGNGACEFMPDHAQCIDGAGGLCSPDHPEADSRGCVYEDCGGRTCVPPNRCMVADCDGDQCVLESACGAGEFCCGGECVPEECEDGDPCTTGRCDVDLGCIQEPNPGATCDDELYCNGVGICDEAAQCVQQGDPCPSSTVCDEATNRCVGCRAGHPEDCPPRSTGSWSSCEFGTLCTESGSRTRRVTTYTCVDEVCQPSETTETDTCPRDTDGRMCDDTTCDPWGSCDYGDICGETGTRQRDCTYRECGSGTCRSRTGTETESCSPRDTDGTACGSTSCTSWGNCENFSSACDTTGNQSRTCTDQICSSGSCDSQSRGEAKNCTRTTDGDPCDDSTFCNGADQCSSGMCTTHAGNPCSAPTDVCVEGTGCVECADDGDCGGSTPRCVSGTCEECAGNSDCGGSTPYCSGGTCVQCRNSGDCAGSLSCVANQCSCVDHSDCDDGNSCTTDTCSSGACTNSPIAGCCNDAGDCTGTCDSCGMCMPSVGSCDWECIANTCECNCILLN